MGIDCLLVAQHRHRALCPWTIENCLLQHLQIFPGHLILAVYQIGLCQTFHHTGTLIIIRYGLHRLKSEALGRVHQAKIEIDLARQL